jgi:hypothetical protein
MTATWIIWGGVADTAVDEMGVSSVSVTHREHMNAIHKPQTN